MNKHSSIVFFFAALVAGAHAQVAPSPPAGVTESTDPARAEAVQRAASGIQERAARDPRAGRPSLARNKTSAGLAYLSGGVSVEDRATMQSERADYNLWVSTVAKPSGAYLAGARLRVVDLKSKSAVLEREMDGPWLMLALPAGRYQIEATFKADGADKPQTLWEQVNIAPSVLRQAVLRFESKAQVSPDVQSSSDGNALGVPGATPPTTPTR